MALGKQGHTHPGHTTLGEECWVVEDILASLACAKTKQKLSEIVFIVREPV